MISNKHFNVIVSITMVIAICFSSLLLLLPKSSSISTTIEQPDYVTTIFDDDKVIDINIEIDEITWQDMLDNAINEEYTAANITVNGTTYNNVAIRPKGNSSLSQIYSDDSTDRYSFKIKFDEYVDGQTLDGLSKLVLNNTMSDATYMKEYLSYDLLSTLGVATPECAYANITVNGEEWGLYLAIEPIEEEFIERYYGSSDGNLYKPESDSVAVGGGGGDKENMDDGMKYNENFDPSQMQAPTDTSSGDGTTQMQTPPDMNSGDATTQMQIGGGMGGGMNSNTAGADLVWNGGDTSDYSAIFDSAIFKSTDSDDYTKILDMIEHLDSLEDIESYLDVDEVLKYFAANTFLVNLDSYASNMKHNYYLYENDGVVSILPWDYNLSFAGFQAGSSSNAINFPIDSPVSGTTLEESPLIGKLLEVDEYKELYHSYLNEIVENYINNGTYEATITKIDSLISEYVKNDATAFYTFEEYTTSLPNLINFGYDRATSISAQLDGSQPSTSTGTIETTVDLNAMGQQGGGNDKGGMPNMNKDNDNSTTQPSDSSTPPSTNDNINVPTENTMNNNDPGDTNTTSIDRDIMMQAMQILQSSEDGTITDTIKPELENLGLTEENITELSSFQAPQQGNNDNINQDFTNTNIAMGPNKTNSANSTNNIIVITSAASIGLLVLALIFVLLFKKRKYIS